jgi:hypothetical protein
MKSLELIGAVRHIYVIRRLKINQHNLSYGQDSPSVTCISTAPRFNLAPRTQLFVESTIRSLDWVCFNFCYNVRNKTISRIINFFIYQLMHKRIALKIILKFTLKQLLHVSVQSSSGNAYSSLLKLQFLK